jgi:hypothetical protein
MTEERTREEPHQPTLDDRLDVISAIVLSVTVVLTAFAAWQSTLWSGEQAESYARASGTRVTSNAALTQGATEQSYDATLFAIGLSDFFAGNQGAVDILRERLVREEFQPYLDDWLETDPLNNPDAPRNPFQLPEYENANVTRSQQLSEEAERLLNEGNEANENGDNYVLAAVFFAAVLFFTGITTKFESDSLRTATVAMAVVALVGATIFMLTLPRLFEA